MSASTALAETMTCCGPIPRGEKRRREIAIVAERVFFENGFGDTTMQAIAARAGASKETLYRHFGSKEGLFAEIVEARSKRFLEKINENFERPGSVADVLRDLGFKMFEKMTEPTAISLCRLVVAEQPRNPELGQIFYAAGPERVMQRLTQYLGGARDRGEIHCLDPALTARIFLGGLVSTYHLARLVLETPPVFSPAQIEAHVEELVAMVMAHCAPR